MRGGTIPIHEVVLPSGFEISDDRARLDMEFVHATLETAYWAAGRTQEQTARSWANCLCVGVYEPGGAMAGFGRVLTDYTFRAHLGDVLLRPDVRGRGLGRALIGAILAHPELVTVKSWTLTTADAHGLYSAFGFQRTAGDPGWMTLRRE